MAERFYVNWPLAPGPITLDGPEAHHLATVCRLRPGDYVCLFNGDGKQYPGEVLETAKKYVVLEIHAIEEPQRERPFRLEVAAPLPKGDRADFLIEKLTELGVTRFTPLQTTRSVVHPREAKLDRLQRHVIEASKQCGRNVLMKIEPLTPWPEFLSHADLPQRRVLAHVGQETTNADQTKQAVVVAVGPEGGFTRDEVSAAGWEIVGLGPRVLRVETAAIVLATMFGG